MLPATDYPSKAISKSVSLPNSKLNEALPVSLRFNFPRRSANHAAMARRFLCILVFATFVGCGSNEPFDYVKVQGTVTYDDGTPLPIRHFQLRFASEAPPKGNAFPRPAQTDVSDGKFDTVTSHKFGDGLVPGKHKVIFAYATDAKGKLVVPPEYTEGSTTQIEIDTADSPLVIRVPKPTESATAAKTK
jgi:hypothetical protein